MSEAVSIRKHEGKKYLRVIRSAFGDRTEIDVDVYCVIKAFKITCSAQAHALKKVLCAGERGKGSRIADLKGAIAALNRAIELEEEDGEHQKQDIESQRTPEGLQENKR